MRLYFSVCLPAIVIVALLLCGSCKKKSIEIPDPPRPQPPAPYVGLKVKDGNIVDKDGISWVPYGVNSVHVWLNEANSLNALSLDIPKSKANVVRLVTSGSSWTLNNQSINAAQKRNLVQKVVAAGLVPMLEMHDATCVTNVPN